MKHFHLLLITLLTTSFLLSVFTFKSNASDSVFPFKEHPIGSFFTKNGKSCTCHPLDNCIPSGKSCNCVRYYTYKGKKYDLLGVQCIGFARMCQLRLFGYIDYGDTKNKFMNIAKNKLYAGTYSLSTLKEILNKAPVGSHIRIGTHSIIILSKNKSGFTSYECNSSVKGRECLIFSRSFTFESFYKEYKSSDLHYVNFPKEVEKQETTAVSTSQIVTTKVNITTAKPIITTAQATSLQSTAPLPPSSAPAEGVYDLFDGRRFFRLRMRFERIFIS